MGLQIQPINQDTVITVDIFTIIEKRKCTIDVQQINVTIFSDFCSALRYEYPPQAQNITKDYFVRTSSIA